MDFNEEEFVQRLVFLRQTFRNMSQREIGRALQINGYSDIEGMRKRCHCENLLKLCRFYDVTADWLLTGDPTTLKESVRQLIDREVMRQVRRTTSISKVAI
ncbi:MAG: hypothetical protein CML17_02130 [Pusillimonas sp.]|jgi:transcriptional regulator with XRE-family HTH domain|nr:hypothetical protein [Pusillimonas sp.]|tara:strand:+ start:232 stop:534 length:303 start_codon:yes stop_codon:yes gene_type:complete